VKQKHRVAIALIIAILVVGLLVVFVRPLRYFTRTSVTTVAAHLVPSSHESFPVLNLQALTPRQALIVSLAQKEYQKHPVSYDQTVQQYTQGVKEAWCADFASWIMKNAGAAYTNPHSGSWRIPGVLTLQEYYKSQHRYVAAGSYEPQVGDVAFYVGSHTFDMFSTEHVAIVISRQGNTMTTIGGNEGGKLRLDTQTTALGENSLVGFGRL
jgi:hypothetical protein